MSQPYDANLPPAYEPRDAPRQAPQLACPLCGCVDFQREESRQEGVWGFSSHVMVLMICQQCRYVLHFYDGHSFFTVD